MDVRKYELTCINCKHFPCFEHDKQAIHTGQLSMNYNIIHNREFPCTTFKSGKFWEPNEMLAEILKSRREK
jgi:hypothetical protein